ncbi:hypothetical protein ACA910_016491 [Epithemia clementina (nom. ined.)]
MASTERSSLLDNSGINDTPMLNAREAFEGANADASRMYHEVKSAKEGHKSEGGFLKPVIFGGLDGILTSFAIVAGAAGGKLSPEVVLILGFSNILADALSMGVGEFLSSKANNEWILSERRREEWELESYPEGEIKEMVEIYESKGMSRDDAVLVIQTMAKYKDLFVDVMMSQELELQVPEENHVTESMKEGFVMFCSFACFGAMPLLGYVLIPVLFPGLGPDILFWSACCITGVVLFCMGVVKSFFTTQHGFYTGMETLLLGGACATVAYSVGQLVEHGLGYSEDV